MSTVLALFGVVMASAMADLLIPADKGCGTRKYLHLVTSLAVLLLILSPIVSFCRQGTDDFWSLPENGDTEAAYQALFDGAMNEGGKAAFREGVARSVAGEFHIKQENVGVDVTYEGEDPVFVRVTLSGAGLLRDPDDIAAYLNELLGIEVEVR